MEKLQEYLDKLNSTFSSIMEDQIITMSVYPEIKEPFNTYIIVFSFPTDGVWNPDLLALVKEQVNANGPEAAQAYLLANKQSLLAEYNIEENEC